MNSLASKLELGKERDAGWLFFPLFPKLCLGKPSRKLCLPASGSWSFQDFLPKQSLGKSRHRGGEPELGKERRLKYAVTQALASRGSRKIDLASRGWLRFCGACVGLRKLELPGCLSQTGALIVIHKSKITVFLVPTAPAWECIPILPRLTRYGFPRRTVGTRKKLPFCNLS